MVQAVDEDHLAIGPHHPLGQDLAIDALAGQGFEVRHLDSVHEVGSQHTVRRAIADHFRARDHGIVLEVGGDGFDVIGFLGEVELIVDHLLELFEG